MIKNTLVPKALNHLRMAKTALRTPLLSAQNQRVHEPIVSPFRVLPHELDIRDHLPNYAFFRFAEMNINKWAFVTAVDKRPDYDVWILSATQVVFLKQIKALQRFHVKTQVMHWDKKYAYFQHEFILHYGKPKQVYAAILLSKLVFSHQNNQTPPKDILGSLPNENSLINAWKGNQAEIKKFFS